MNSVSEKIDERILRLLGLDDVFDLDYDTYMTLLKEAIVVGRDKIPQEELALLANERKRIRGKKGRFKPKREKITADKVATTKFLKPTKKTLALPASISLTNIQQNLGGVGKPLQSIAKTLGAILKFNKKTNEEERKEKESQKRTKREEGLEGFRKGISAVSGAAKKMLAPFQSIIDRIWRFIFFTLLGRAFTQLMDWLGDPKNKRKIEVLGRFLKDWWPSLAFAAGLFLTPFGGFIRKTITLLRGFIPQMLKIIPQLTRFAIANPGTIPIVAATIGGVAKIKESERMKPLTQESQKEIDKTLKSKDAPWYQKLGASFAGQSLNAPGGPVNPIGLQSPGAGFASGGLVPRFTMGGMNLGTGYGGIDNNTGERVSGFGPDTQAIIAQPGEIVMNKKTVDAMGPGYFLGLNRQYGGPGANKPKMGKLYNTGGMVGNNRMPLKDSIKYAQERLLSKQAERNTNTRNKSIRPWWDRLNPFSNKTPFNQSMPNSPIQNYRMPGYTYNKWLDLDRFRTDPNPETYRPNPNNPKSRFAPYYQRPGVNKPLLLQGGGFLGGLDNMGRSVFENVGGTIGRNRGRETGIPGGGFLGERLGEREGRKRYEQLLSPFKRMGGGLIKENTGMNIPGATADRQLAALHPGEYVLPAGTVSKLGVPFIDMMVAMTDYDSTAAKLGKKPINRPNITPLSRTGVGGMITLPPITQSAGGSMGNGSPGGSKVPSFSAVSPSGGGERAMNASIYGIVG